jgi:hypothetical protein
MKSFLAKETPLKRSIRESHLDLRIVASSAVVNCDRRDDGYNESGSKSKTGILCNSRVRSAAASRG